MLNLEVGVVADWAQRYRGEVWGNLLKSFGCTYARHRIADSLLPRPGTDVAPSDDVERRAPAGPAGGTLTADDRRDAADDAAEHTGGQAHADVPSFLDVLGKLDVLVVNWDAVNGDPEFGADIALRWFAHHRRELWQWVARGGVLIVEGQAIVDVPDQAAYDALLGPDELRVCGDVDPLNADAQISRVGTRGLIYPSVKDNPLFAGLNELDATRPVRFKDMFPRAGVDPKFEMRDWRRLYRGWFTRRGPRSKFAWQIIATTTGHRFRRRPICMAARHGEGAIFATTMLLASSGQKELVAAMLKSHRNARSLPTPNPLLRPAARQLVQSLLPAAMLLVASTRSEVDAFGRFLATAAGLVLGCVVFVAPGPRAGRRIRRWWRHRKR